jgi:hypothetical protein
MLGHLPMLFARQAETAAVIDLGTGITGGTCSSTHAPACRPVRSAGVVAAAPLFDFVNHRPLADPRRLILMD